ncbi:Homeobox protein KNOX3 [Hordeum vulgare]|nr:Homeobox protein KNOX3 [Hordeum vulgare]
MPEDACKQSCYAADNHVLWTTYFQRHHAEQLESTNGGSTPRGRHNSEGLHQWWCAPGRTLPAVLEIIEGGNEPQLKYLVPSFSRHRGSSWLSRRMDPLSLSSSGSRSSGSVAPLVHIKPELQETLPRRRNCSGNLIINKGRCVPSPSRDHIRLVKPKNETATVMKQEHEDMAADLESGLAWSRVDYVA